MNDEALQIASGTATPEPPNAGSTPLALFAALLLRRPFDVLADDDAVVCAWADAEAARWIDAGRAPVEERSTLAFRFVYRALRDRAAGVEPVAADPRAPRWSRVLSAACGLRHRQRAVLSLYYCMGVSLEAAGAVVGIGPTETRRVIESAVAAVARALGEPVDVRRSLRVAAQRLAGPSRGPVAADDAAPRSPRSVMANWIEAAKPPMPPEPDPRPLPDPAQASPAAPPGEPPAPPTPLPRPEAASRRRRSPLEALLASVEAAPADLGPAVVRPRAPEPALLPPLSPRARRIHRPVHRTGRRPQRRTPVPMLLAAVVLIVGVLVPAAAREDGGQAVPRARASVAPAKVVPAAPSVPAVQVAGVAFVMVQPGDSLWRIAERDLGDPFLWRGIWRMNRGKAMIDGVRFSDPAVIRPGWRLRLPR